MKSVNKLLLPLVCVLTLVGCGPSEEPLVNIVDVKSALTALQQADNYLIETFDSKNEKVFSGQYDASYFYESISNYGYLVKENKTYPFHFQNTTIITKEALDIENLYDENSPILNADSLDLNLVPDNVNTFSSLKRSFSKPLLNMCGYGNEMYASLKECTITLANKELDVAFTFNHVVPGEGLKTYTEKAHISQIREINLPLIIDFINKGTLTEIHADLLKIRDLFRLDNYTQYQTDGVGVVQVDLFNPMYFATLFTDYAIKQSPVLQMNQAAYLTICKPDKALDLLKDNEGKPVPLIYDDTYRFQYFGTYEQKGELTLITRPSPKRPGYAEGGFQEVVKNVPTTFHYPKGLLLFNNLDELVKVEGHNAFSLTDRKLIDNVLADYALTGSFDEFGGINEIQFIYEFGKTDAEAEVILRLVAPMGVYDITYDKFGVTTFEPFETLLSEINK